MTSNSILLLTVIILLQSALSQNNAPIPPTPPGQNCTIPMCVQCDTAGQVCATCTKNSAIQNGKCACNGRFFYNQANNSCDACMMGCDICSNANECSSCIVPFVKNGATGKCECSTGYFYNTQDTTCRQCPLTCDQCTGVGADQCYQCEKTATVFIASASNASIGTCDCPPDHYTNTNRFQLNYSTSPPVLQVSCVACTIIGCAKCNTFGQCETCKPGMKLEWGRCDCDEGFYLENPTGTCKPCAEGCASCPNGVNQCVRCKSQAMSVVNGNCLCNDGSFTDPTSKKCIPCDPACQTCNGGGPTDCMSCPGLRKTWNFQSKVCDCSNGYYKDAHGNCRACHNSCFMCNGALPDQCTACSGSNRLQVVDTQHGQQVGPCKCPEGHFSAGSGSCSRCHDTCLRCAGPSESECLTCKNEKFVANNPPGKCVCPDATFLTMLNGVQTCAGCPKNCQTCSGDNLCFKCYVGFELSSSRNTCGCPVGTYYSETQNVCLRCGALCGNCQSEQTCSKCLEGAELTSNHTCICSSNAPLYISLTNKCITSCETGRAYDIQQQDCVGCRQDLCLECSTKDCLKCVAGYNLYQGKCVSKCPKGLYQEPTTKICEPCSSNCSTCVGSPTSCTSCPIGLVLSSHTGSGTCKQPLECPDGMYFAPSSFQCLPCHNACNTCNGPAHLNCLSCKMDGVFQHGQCVRCQDVPGFTLDKEHGGCEPICGDGMRLGRERCDDGNRKPGDGCNQICQVESGYICLKNEDQLNDTCYLRPKATFEISPADPYNILVKFDHEMQEDHLCSQFSLRSNGADRAALDLNVTVTQVANKECVIHIEYPITLLGDVIYLRINNTNMMVDNNSFPIDPSNNDFIATFEGYIISGEHKHQFAKLTILVSKAFKWLVAIILVWSLPLFRYNSGYLIWNLVDFLQRLCILTMIQTRLPFNLQEFLNSINFIVFDIDHGYELPWLHLKFFSNAWPLLIFIVGVEILNLIFAIMANLCGMHADIRTKFRWTIRLRLYSICTFPVALVVFDCLNPAHIYADILSACLAGGTAFLYILFSLKILRDLSIAFDPFSSKISKQIDLAYKYYEFLNEVNFKNLVARLYPLMVVQTRVFEAVIVCYVGIFSSRMQVVLLMGIESVMLAMNSSLDVLSDKSVKRLTMLQQIVMIAILACIGIIGESKEGVLNIQIAWGIEIAVAVMVLILFAVNMKRLLIRSALNIRLSVDKMINQWKDSFNNTEGQSLKQNEKKPVSDEGKKVQSADQSHFKISEEDEEAQ